MFSELAELRDLLAGLDAPWGFAGGWALSLFAGAPLRKHDDVEITIFREDQGILRDYLPDWNFSYVPHGSGRVSNWPADLYIAHPSHEAHAEGPGGRRLEVLFNERQGDYWVFRKDQRVRRRSDRAFRINQSLPYLAPEIALLYKAMTGSRRPKDPALSEATELRKSKDPALSEATELRKSKDEGDFQTVLPLLDAEQADWLREAIQTCSPGHPWLASLSSFKSALRRSYDRDASRRDQAERAGWKNAEREAFLERLEGAGARTLLEIGAGPGHDSLFFQGRGLDVTATDLSPEMVRLCREKGVPAHVRDFYNLGFPPASFDAVWALNCLLHVPKADLPGVLEGIREVLKPGGLFYFGVYGGRDEEGIYEKDWQEPKRWFTFYTDEAIRAAVEPFFELVRFRAIDLEEDGGLHFQATLWRKT